MRKILEGNKEKGFWLQNTAVDQSYEHHVAFVEKAKTNPWQTLAEYNEAHGTTCTWR